MEKGQTLKNINNPITKSWTSSQVHRHQFTHLNDFWDKDLLFDNVFDDLDLRFLLFPPIPESTLRLLLGGRSSTQNIKQLIGEDEAGHVLDSEGTCHTKTNAGIQRFSNADTASRTGPTARELLRRHP